MNDKTIQTALKALPTARVRPGFSRELMEKLPERSENRAWMSPLRLGLATAMAAVLVLAWLVSPLGPQQSPHRSAAVSGPPASEELPGDPGTEGVGSARVAAQAVPVSLGEGDERLRQLMAERQAILAELDQVRREARALRRVLYLGGDETVDVVVDLSEVARRHPSNGIQPAAYRPR
jgi:hypothetical protein